MPRRTPLFDLHHREGAKFVEFAGWELPLHFGSILEEAKAVRSSCGMFDVSHMGRIGVQACKRVSVNVVASAQANSVAEKLDWLVTMDVKNLAVGQVRYGFLCNERGGIIDDLTVARLGESEFLLVVNASRREVDFAWMRKHLPADVEIVDRTFETAMIAVQGPDALEIVDGLVDSEEKPSFEAVSSVSSPCWALGVSFPARDTRAKTALRLFTLPIPLARFGRRFVQKGFAPAV